MCGVVVKRTDWHRSPLLLAAYATGPRLSPPDGAGRFASTRDFTDLCATGSCQQGRLASVAILNGGPRQGLLTGSLSRPLSDRKWRSQDVRIWPDADWQLAGVEPARTDPSFLQIALRGAEAKVCFRVVCSALSDRNDAGARPSVRRTSPPNRLACPTGGNVDQAARLSCGSACSLLSRTSHALCNSNQSLALLTNTESDRSVVTYSPSSPDSSSPAAER